MKKVTIINLQGGKITVKTAKEAYKLACTIARQADLETELAYNRAGELEEHANSLLLLEWNSGRWDWDYPSEATYRKSDDLRTEAEIYRDTARYIKKRGADIVRYLAKQLGKDFTARELVDLRYQY